MAKKLAQLKRDAAKSDWGVWCKHWDRDPRHMHPNDERALLEGCYFDLLAANRIHEWYEQAVTLPASGNSRKPFLLFDFWFRDVLGPVFGWKRPDGRRRFTKVFVTTAKKSGKSTTLSALPLYMIKFDDEPEAEAYATATDRDQASVIFHKTELMLRKSPELSKLLKITPSTKRIWDPEDGHWFEALSADADSADGKNWHLLIMDELHRWKKRDFYDALVYGDIQREQPLLFQITTAGEYLDGIGYEEYTYNKDLMDPNVDVYDASRLGVICEPGYEKDKSGKLRKDENGKPIPRAWDDPESWIEANPVILEDNPKVRLDRLKSNCDEAKTSAAKKRRFMRFTCNLWIGGADNLFVDWFDWLACGEQKGPKSLVGRQCGAGLDLSSSIDLTSLCLAFPDDTGGYDLRWRFWMPQDNLEERAKQDKVPYVEWAEAGWIEATPGRRIDFAYIRKAVSGVTLDEKGGVKSTIAIDAAARKYDLTLLGYDPKNAEKLISELSDYDGINTLAIKQGYEGMSLPCKHFRDVVVDHNMRHGSNPVANWMVRHCINDSDPYENIKLNKAKSRTRIDGIVAAVMAVEASKVEVSGAWSGEGAGMWG